MFTSNFAAWLEESLDIEVPEWGYDLAKVPVRKSKKQETPRLVLPHPTQMNLF